MINWQVFTSVLRRCLGAALVGSLVACSGMMTKDLPPAPAQAAVQDYSYIIGAGDGLNIIVWRNPELSMSVPVRPDGKISAPLVEEMVVQHFQLPQRTVAGMNLNRIVAGREFAAGGFG